MRTMKTTVQNIKKAQSVMAFLLILLGAAFTHVSWANQTMYFIHNDHLGTPQVVTDANQSVVWQADYQPFGEVDITTNHIDQDARFPGQYIDDATGLHYNYFRDYDPTIGRYIQSDPIGLNAGFNTYGYVGGNPLIYSDPRGLQAGTVAGCAAGVLAGPGGCGVGAVIGTLINLGGGLYVGHQMMTSDLGDDAFSEEATSDAASENCINEDADKCYIEFVRELPSHDGITKTCWYRRKGTMFTFPQAVGYPCPPIDKKRCLVDTSFIRPPARH